MKGLINIFVRRPVTVIMILAAQIIAAVFSLFILPVNRLPEFSVPRVTVETLYPGMAANEIRSLVTIPLEDGLSPIKGLERIRSVSRDNRSLISLDFRWGTDPMAASVLVREAIDAVYPGLPEGVRKPTVTSGDSANEAHAVIAVSSHNGNNEFARILAEYEMQARLRRIDGVGSVVLVGGEKTEEKLLLDIQRLAALGFAPSDFARQLAQETADIPAGNAREGNMELVVVGSGKPDSLYSLSQVILSAGNGTLKVEDAGELFSSAAQRESIFVYDGKEAAGLEIYRRPGSDPLRLSRDIKKVLEEASSQFSRDVEIELVTDSSSSLIGGLTGLLISAMLAAAAVVTVLLIFIRRLKYSLLAALSIPVSIAAGIWVLAVTGKSLNSMSLSGLAIGIGLVSDISIIVLNLLHRSFGERKTIPEPEEIGNKTSSISGSSITSTITTALVFIPVIMLPGPLGSLFGDIAIALVTSVTAGWLYAQFCLPSLYLLFFNSKLSPNKIIKEKQAVFTDGSLVKKYSFILSTLLHKPGKLFAIAALLSVIGFLTLFMRPVVFLNPDEAEEVWVSVNSPPGTLLESIVSLSNKASIIISGLPSVKTVYGRAGAEEEDISRRADIDYKKEELILRCVLKKGVKPENALAEITLALNEYGQIPFTAYFPRDRIEVLLGLSAERTFVIKSKNRDELFDQIEIAENAFNAASMAVNFRPRGQRPELRLYPNRETTAYLSIPASQIAETLYILNEGVVATKLEIEGRPHDVRVIGQNTGSYNTIKQLEQIPVKTHQGKTVYLGSLGRIEQKEAEASLARLDRSDVIYMDIISNGDIPAEVKEFAERADDSVFIRYRNSLFIYILLVLILLYMTMGAQFESFLLPLILMMSIPFSLAGAGPALLIIGAKIDSGAILGLAALFGLVINNSLLLFEISDQKICAGLPAVEAVNSGACERFQAIIITMITTIFALLPLILSPLGNSQKSMAAAMLGGLAASTLLSLFAIPPVLVHYFRWKLRRESCAGRE
ncbi:MAG: efflux RND transporter permease subunit [Treponema sp.]|nr:efflux RND transporter permease subunit [Treponema sp.]